MHKQVCSLWQRDVGGKTLDDVNHVGKSALTHYLQTNVRIERKVSNKSREACKKRTRVCLKGFDVGFHVGLDSINLARSSLGSKDCQ